LKLRRRIGVVGKVDSKIESGGKVDLIIKSRVEVDSKIESGGLKVGRGRLPEKVIISCTSLKGFPNRECNCLLALAIFKSLIKAI
jgi:hypothetical protein